jgi:hypothetical protein
MTGKQSWNVIGSVLRHTARSAYLPTIDQLSNPQKTELSKKLFIPYLSFGVFWLYEPSMQFNTNCGPYQKMCSNNLQNLPHGKSKMLPALVSAIIINVFPVVVVAVSNSFSDMSGLWAKFPKACDTWGRFEQTSERSGKF